VLASIGPLWDGNEVWLIAAGGTVFLAFPALYATALSGFYLSVMILLWLLIFRGVAIDFRNHVPGVIWSPLWDVVFCGASLLLALFLGVALGNVVRGVPIDADGNFFEPLWTDFRLGPQTGILDWYTLLTGATVVTALAVHGAMWIRYRTDGAVAERATRLARPAWWLLVVLTAALTACTWLVQRQVPANLTAHAWGSIFPLAAVAGLAGVGAFLAVGGERRAFFSSCVYLAGMLASAVFGVYPYVIPARDARLGLTVHNAHASEYALRAGLVWWSIGVPLAVGYTLYVHRAFARKIPARRQ
jgi:cytochrome bd ubiquinol oxidase subunit II